MYRVREDSRGFFWAERKGWFTWSKLPGIRAGEEVIKNIFDDLESAKEFIANYKEYTKPYTVKTCEFID